MSGIGVRRPEPVTGRHSRLGTDPEPGGPTAEAGAPTLIHEVTPPTRTQEGEEMSQKEFRLLDGR